MSCTSYLIYAVTIRVAVTTQQPHVSAYTGVYQMGYTAYKSCSGRWTNTVRKM